MSDLPDGQEFLLSPWQKSVFERDCQRPVVIRIHFYSFLCVLLLDRQASRFPIEYV